MTTKIFEISSDQQLTENQVRLALAMYCEGEIEVKEIPSFDAREIKGNDNEKTLLN